MASGQRYLGISEPISLAEPTAADRALTEQLETLMRAYSLYDSDEGLSKRATILYTMLSIVREWVKRVGMKKGMDETLALEASAKIYTSGSYRLGVHPVGADMDTLCVGPRHVERDDFFVDLYETLLNTPGVTHLQPVPDAFVPIMKMKFDGIELDLLYAKLDMSIIPETLDLLDDEILRNLDQKSVVSLNGPRVTDMILRLVPEHSVESFRAALRCIKHWAKKRAVYGNTYGYLGGVAWNMLTARICQLYPNACASTLVSRFFRVYDQWKWPTPVLLTQIKEPVNAQHQVWNPRLNQRDKMHLMPIITPAYPSMNSTYNVSKSTLMIMKEEFRRGVELTLKIESKQEKWEKLFERPDFFSRYKNYIYVCVSASSAAEQKTWCGFVESRLRHLIANLEHSGFITCAHPYPAGFVIPDSDPPVSMYFIGLLFEKTHPKQVDLSSGATHFVQLVKEWMGYKPTMKIDVQHIPRSSLPSYVFPEGAPPPRKRKISAVAGGTSSPARETAAGAGASGGAGAAADPSAPAAADETAEPAAKRAKLNDGTASPAGATPDPVAQANGDTPMPDASKK